MCHNTLLWFHEDKPQEMFVGQLLSTLVRENVLCHMYSGIIISTKWCSLPTDDEVHALYVYGKRFVRMEYYLTTVWDETVSYLTRGSSCTDWLRQVRATFVTKVHFQSSQKWSVCSQFWLHLFCRFCASQKVSKIGRNVFLLGLTQSVTSVQEIAS